MYKELLEGTLKATKGIWPCDEIVMGVKIYSKTIYLIESASRSPLNLINEQNKKWNCSYCRNENSAQILRCKSCGAAKIESKSRYNKNEVKFLSAKLILDYSIKENLVRFINTRIPSINHEIELVN